jgi:hypothetical protein
MSAFYVVGSSACFGGRGGCSGRGSGRRGGCGAGSVDGALAIDVGEPVADPAVVTAREVDRRLKKWEVV